MCGDEASVEQNTRRIFTARKAGLKYKLQLTRVSWSFSLSYGFINLFKL